MGCKVSLQVHPLPLHEVPEPLIEEVREPTEVEAKAISLEDFIPTLDEISMETINM
jgi:hypothetical protein